MAPPLSHPNRGRPLEGGQMATIIGQGRPGEATMVGVGGRDFVVVGGEEYDDTEPRVKAAVVSYPWAFRTPDGEPVKTRKTRTRTRADRADSDD